MSIKKLSFMLLSALSLAALLNGCGSSSKEGSSNLGGVARIDEGGCRVCHASSLDPVTATPILQEFLGSAHNSGAVGCQGCHGGGAQHNGVGPIPFPNPLIANRCITCHTNATASLFTLAGADYTGSCASCHSPEIVGKSSLHAAHVTSNDCLGCHDLPVNAPQHRSYENKGVRAIVGDFSKWSHHVTGVTLNAAHCAACHLEGKAEGGKIVIDKNKHMSDGKTHLRISDTDADFAWDPAAPDHSGMDNFCMSCHDADGATSAMSAQIQAFINSNGLAATGKTASASNPFGDTISNRYDKMQRPAVVDASSQFNTTNNSHHAVKGPRYSGNSRFTGVDADGNARRQIASAATFAQNSSALLQGVRSTIYDAGNFNQLYTPLENAGGEAAPRTGAKNLGDDSTLHCGDCHTVGQWKAGSSTNADGTDTTAVIGAHGSNNEYMLRNNRGTDQRHTQNAFLVGNAAGTVLNPATGLRIPNGVVVYTNPNGAFLVCYNCHAYTRYGSIYLANGNNGSHAGEYDSTGRCNGIGNTLPFNGYTTGKATDGTQFLSRFEGPRSQFGATPAFAPGFPLNGTPPAGEQNPDFGNIFGIQCNNCHNSGVGNAYGGIHGSPNNTPRNDGTTIINPDPSITGGAYIDGLGNTTKVQRFLPGLGNTMYVPGTLGKPYVGGRVVPTTESGLTYTYTTGGITDDTNWEQKYGDQVLGTVIPNLGTPTGPTANVGAGCYTLDRTPATGAVGSNQRGPSVTGAGGAATEVLGTWGGCDDHNNVQGGPGERQLKRVVRPVTY